MFSCKDVAARASALVDGELGTWDTLQVKLHLAMCKGCQQFIGQMRVTRDLALRAVQPAMPGTDDSERIDDILSRLHQKQRDKG